MIWILTGNTESGDDIGPYAWNREFTDDEIQSVLVRDMPEEVEADCCTNLNVYKTPN